MLTAEHARQLMDDPLTIQLEQIERGIKETILMRGTALYYKTEYLEPQVAEILKTLGYTVRERIINGFLTGETEITWVVEE